MVSTYSPRAKAFILHKSQRKVSLGSWQTGHLGKLIFFQVRAAVEKCRRYFYHAGHHVSSSYQTSFNFKYLLKARFLTRRLGRRVILYNNGFAYAVLLPRRMGTEQQYAKKGLLHVLIALTLA